jgi:hypothetical protein
MSIDAKLICSRDGLLEYEGAFPADAAEAMTEDLAFPTTRASRNRHDMEI